MIDPKNLTIHTYEDESVFYAEVRETISPSEPYKVHGKFPTLDQAVQCYTLLIPPTYYIRERIYKVLNDKEFRTWYANNFDIESKQESLKTISNLFGV